MKRDAILNEIKTYMSKINLQSGILTVENRRSREKKRICSEVSVNSPGHSWSQSRRSMMYDNVAADSPLCQRLGDNDI